VEGGGTKTAWVLVETVANAFGAEFLHSRSRKIAAIEFSAHCARTFASHPCRIAEANRSRWSFPCGLRNRGGSSRAKRDLSRDLAKRQNRHRQ
jgi:hypothetical protein